MFAENFLTKAGTTLSLASLLRESATSSSLFSVLRGLLVDSPPQSNNIVEAVRENEEDAQMQDESNNSDEQNIKTSSSKLVNTICASLENAMTHLVAALKQVNPNPSAASTQTQSK